MYRWSQSFFLHFVLHGVWNSQDFNNRQVTWRQHNGNGMSWNFLSVEDVFENGASFSQSRSGGGVAVRPNYSAEQIFPIEAAREVRALTKSAGALKCPRVSRCWNKAQPDEGRQCEKAAASNIYSLYTIFCPLFRFFPFFSFCFMHVMAW